MCLLMRPDETDRDWTHADSTCETLPAPDSQRPAPPTHVWMVPGESGEPRMLRTLIEATGEPPRTPEAAVYGGGELLAEGDDGECRWLFTDAGKLRFALEAHGMLERDADIALSLILAADFEVAS